jgi:hypothetical protein
VPNQLAAVSSLFVRYSRFSLSGCVSKYSRRATSFGRLELIPSSSRPTLCDCFDLCSFILVGVSVSSVNHFNEFRLKRPAPFLCICFCCIVLCRIQKECLLYCTVSNFCAPPHLCVESQECDYHSGRKCVISDCFRECAITPAGYPRGG